MARKQGKAKDDVDPSKKERPKPETEKERPQKYKGGGMAGMRRYFRGGKV